MALFLKLYLSALFVFVILDLLWVGVVMKEFYRMRLAHLLGTNLQWVPAVLFYLVFIAGLTYFAALPAAHEDSAFKALLLGAFFGAVAYATYDLTNHAFMRDWPLSITVIDIMWGALVSACAAGAAVVALRLFT